MSGKVVDLQPGRGQVGAYIAGEWLASDRFVGPAELCDGGVARLLHTSGVFGKEPGLANPLAGSTDGGGSGSGCPGLVGRPIAARLGSYRQ
jgi:hypothetical protein